jgi:hypothetical protein
MQERINDLMLNKMHLVFALLGLMAAGCVGYSAVTAQATSELQDAGTPYTVVDAGQTVCYDNRNGIACPAEGQAFSGQDAQYAGNQPSYTLSGDGLTVYDNNTGLTWTQSPDLDGNGDIDLDDKLTFDEAQAYPDILNAQNYGGYSDWRLPGMKELYSLMDFRGTDPMPTSTDPSQLTPFIDTTYFAFAYGDTAAGERIIDSQFWSSNAYVGTVFGSQPAAFGLNLADGRIKGYPTGGPINKTNYVYFVRGNTDYGANDFTDNGDGTVTDNATGLMWSQDDSGVASGQASTGPRSGMNWEDALAWVQQKNDENYLGYSDWRLPNAKEMQSIVDYSRAPDATGSAAIDPVFNITQITNEDGEVDYPWFWTGTTHVRFDGTGSSGVYICFGRAMGYMNGSWLDVHGAGAQRSDRKGGDSTGYTYEPDGYYFAPSPQGDATRIYNYVRLVRDAEPAEESEHTIYLPLTTNGEAEKGTEDASGYNLFAPLNSTTTYLLDGDGDVVYTWDSTYRPGNAVYLLENGNLLRTGNTGSGSFDSGGAGGIVEEIAPDGTLVWDFEYADSQHRLHHDVEPLPDGNVLMIAWEYKTEAEALAAGRDPGLLTDDELWPDTVIEVDPDTDTIVWEWHVWDHLVQDYNAGQGNFGVVADHPERIDLNYSSPGAPPGRADWNHINAIDYSAEFDQILLSVRNFSEIWVVDHSTTTAEAAGHEGGDLLYRWGNPAAYGAGDVGDQQLFVQHDAQWIPAGYPGEGNILVFKNGTGRPAGDYSSVDEIVPPVDGSGRYTSYGPSAPTWTYNADSPTDFYAADISGAQRLPDSNTLICDGPNGYFFEVTPAGDIVWDYGYEGHVFRVTRYATDYAGLPNMGAQQGAAPADTARPAAPPAGGDQLPPAGQPPAGGQGQRPDLAAAAQKLGVSVEALRAALGEPGQEPPDLAAAAARLGVAVETLREALPALDGSPGGDARWWPTGGPTAKWLTMARGRAARSGVPFSYLVFVL